MNTTAYNKLFDKVIEKYHVIDSVDQPFENPYDKNSFDDLLTDFASVEKLGESL